MSSIIIVWTYQQESDEGATCTSLVWITHLPCTTHNVYLLFTAFTRPYVCTLFLNMDRPGSCVRALLMSLSQCRLLCVQNCMLILCLYELTLVNANKWGVWSHPVCHGSTLPTNVYRQLGTKQLYCNIYGIDWLYNSIIYNAAHY